MTSRKGATTTSVMASSKRYVITVAPKYGRMWRSTLSSARSRVAVRPSRFV